MADPLSLTASIIAILGVTDSVGKALSKVRVLKESPDELLALINEVSDFKVVLYDIERQFRNRPPTSDALMVDQYSHLSELIQRAKDPLLKLEEMIEYQFKRAESGDGHFKVSRIEWLRAKVVVERLRQTLRDTRQNIQSYMTLINTYVENLYNYLNQSLYQKNLRKRFYQGYCDWLTACSTYQSQIALAVDQVFFVSTQLQASQTRNSDQITRQLDQQSELLSSILGAQAESQDTTQATQQQAQVILGRSASFGTQTLSTISIQTSYISQNSYSLCHESCHCCCHANRRFRSPGLLARLIGALFIGYSGSPGVFLKCSIKNCRAQSYFKASITYMFPPWLIHNILISVSLRTSANRITTSLTVRNVVSRSATIFHYISNNDTDGLRRLFDSRLARPNDIQEGGGVDALSVR